MRQVFSPSFHIIFRSYQKEFICFLYIGISQQLQEIFQLNKTRVIATAKGPADRHIRAVHEEKKPFHCDIYNERFFSRNTHLGKHFQSIHKKTTKMKFEICDASYANQRVSYLLCKVVCEMGQLLCNTCHYEHVILDKAFFKYSVNNSVGYNCMCRNTYKYIVLLPQACAFYGGIKCTHTITVTQTNMLPTSTEEHALK